MTLCRTWLTGDADSGRCVARARGTRACELARAEQAQRLEAASSRTRGARSGDQGRARADTPGDSSAAAFRVDRGECGVEGHRRERLGRGPTIYMCEYVDLRDGSSLI